MTTTDRGRRVDADRLESLLRQSVDGEVRFDRGSRAAYSTDASNYRQIPIGVVVPHSVDDIVATAAACREVGAPVLARGGGTSLAGQCCNVAVVIDTSKVLHHVLEIDPDRRLARVQPGCVLDDLRAAAGEHGLTFGPDPATHNRCTLGGMIGNNSCGIHSVMAGRTADNVEELEVLTGDGERLRVGRTSDGELERILAEGGRRGEIYAGLRDLRDRYAGLIRERYPDIPRRVSGYNLDELLPENGFHVARALVGSESTCVLVLEATLNLVPDPASKVLVVLGYPDVYHAGDDIPQIMSYGPVGLEGIDHRLVEFMDRKGMRTRERGMLPDGEGWLLVEFGGADRSEAEATAQRLIDDLASRSGGPSAKLFDDPDEERHIWEVRESGLGATARVPGESDAWPGWEDAAVPPDRVGDYLRDFRGLMDRYGYDAALYGHFGQGCIHCRITFDLVTASGVSSYRAFVGEAADLVASYGGSFSGEHGDGQSRGELLAKLYGPELVEAFRDFKSIWDPEWRMNPGKVVDPDPIVTNLKLGPSYNPWRPRTTFAFPDDDGELARATLRCAGVGKCRRSSGGTMCPSYRATREEIHSTRGRARLLFEMLNGEEIRDGWRSEEVREALDLCLACKGCKGDCPVNVDVATYKAEFMSHHYRGRLRPAPAYGMGLIMLWARVASLAPELVNALAGSRLAEALKPVAGIAAERDIPPFAAEPFTRWWRRQPPVNPTGPPVLLWPDTFNTYFRPDTAKAAVEVLAAAGFQVLVPPQQLCCGRPLYDFGFLGLAKLLLRRVIRVLKPRLRAGVPVVGLEPSCIAVFRDELRGLFPDDPDAALLASNTFTLAEFLQRHADGFEVPTLDGTALVHGHCHHKAIMGFDPDRAVLDALGLDYRVLDSGCCGMAGSFGFEAGDKYEVSVACADEVLVPEIRDADEGAMIIADGFSCREQIRQLTGREALHLAEVLNRALHGVVRPDRT